ncbi:hypothetical protein AB6A40_005659 [Gnathostoma spinigerum]|uniref:ubiquitinyl hydrolase 1 n=1 Tax=Gnathostoma spinigerum TaxID=75299 RepID=A0ABD6EG29_9BILA
MTILPNKPKKNQSKNEKQIRSSSVIQSHSPDTALSGAATHDSLASNSEAATNSSRKIGTKHGFGNKVYNAGCSPQSTKSCLWRDGSVERNSDDENGQGFRDESLDSAFEERLRRVRGLKIKEMQGDGACLFRAVADQVYGDQEMHSDVRRLCLDYMEKNRDHFSQFITEDFEKYIARKRRNDAHGNHIELQAISEIFSRPIEIYDYTTEPKNIFTPTRDSSAHSEPNAPIRLSYHGSVHYNSGEFLVLRTVFTMFFDKLIDTVALRECKLDSVYRKHIANILYIPIC